MKLRVNTFLVHHELNFLQSKFAVSRIIFIKKHFKPCLVGGWSNPFKKYAPVKLDHLLIMVSYNPFNNWVVFHPLYIYIYPSNGWVYPPPIGGFFPPEWCHACHAVSTHRDSEFQLPSLSPWVVNLSSPFCDPKMNGWYTPRRAYETKAETINGVWGEIGVKSGLWLCQYHVDLCIICTTCMNMCAIKTSNNGIKTHQ